MEKHSPIFIILGPTSSGKTSLALDLCKKFNGEIISADSRQVFKYMDIGTGKLPVGSDIEVEKQNENWVLDGIRVWGYDLATPDKYFSGVDFAEFALTKAREIKEKGKNIFVVGGTGFYIDIFTGKVKPSKVQPDFDIRKSLEQLSLEALQTKLSELNPKVFEKIDKQNKVRLVRAIEKELSKKISEIDLPYLKNTEFIFIGLNAPREKLYKKADLWVENIWDGGLIEETKKLLELGYEKSPKLHGLVYKTALSFIRGECTREDAIQQTKYDVHSYIRRQLTYFRKNQNISWVDITQDGFREIIYNRIKKELK